MKSSYAQHEVQRCGATVNPDHREMRDRGTFICDFLKCLPFCALLLVAFGATAQQTAKVPRIGVVVAGAPWGSLSLHQAFITGMREHGCVEGRDYVMEVRNSEGKQERYVGLTAELVQHPLDLLWVGVCGAPLNAARPAPPRATTGLGSRACGCPGS